MQAEELKVIVTGAASGLGRHYALSLCRWGADVAAGDVEVAGLASLAEEAVGAPGLLCTRRLDVRESASCRGFVDWAADAMGGLNALVNIAGILRDGLLVKRERKTGRVLRLSEEDFQAVLDVNLVGATRMAQEVAVRMLEPTRGGCLLCCTPCLSSVMCARPGRARWLWPGANAWPRSWANDGRACELP